MKKIFLIIIFLLIISSVNATINATIQSPTEGWSGTYALLLNVTTDGNANVIYWTSANPTPITLYLNTTSGSTTLNTSYLDVGNNTIWVNSTDPNNAADVNTTSKANIAIDLTAPNWDTTNQTLEYRTGLNYDTSATDSGSGIDSYTTNNTDFTISTGIMTNTTPLATGTYHVNITVNDSVNNINSTTMEIIVNDTITTTITAVVATPGNTTATITWTTSEEANSTITIGTTNTTGTSYVTSHSISLTGLSAATTYGFNITSCDENSLCNTTGVYNFTTTAATTSTTVATTGSGTVTKTTLTKGKQKTLVMDKTDKVLFTVAGEVHYAQISKILEEYIEIIIRSETERINLTPGETKKLDIDENGIYDLMIKLEGIYANTAELTIQLIEEPITQEQTQQNIQEPKIEETKEEKITTQKIIEEVKKSQKWIYIIILIIIITIGLYIKTKQKPEKPKIDRTFGFGQ